MLSWDKKKNCTPIAIVRSKTHKEMDKKILYLDTSNVEVKFDPRSEFPPSVLGQKFFMSGRANQVVRKREWEEIKNADWSNENYGYSYSKPNKRQRLKQLHQNAIKEVTKRQGKTVTIGYADFFLPLPVSDPDQRTAW